MSENTRKIVFALFACVLLAEARVHGTPVVVAIYAATVLIVLSSIKGKPHA